MATKTVTDFWFLIARLQLLESEVARKFTKAYKPGDVVLFKRGQMSEPMPAQILYTDANRNRFSLKIKNTKTQKAYWIDVHDLVVKG